LNVGQSWDGRPPVFEPEFSNSTPLTWPVNRRRGAGSLD